MSKTIFHQIAKSGAGPASLIATGIGFFSDFVKPYFNLIPVFLVISIIASILWWFLIIQKSSKKNQNFEQILETKNGKILGVLFVSTAYWFILTPVFMLSPVQGFAATASESVAEWQESLFGKLDNIEKKIDTGFEKVLEKIDQIDQNAGLISNPKSPNDFYHNARIQELNGNLLEARKSYQSYLDNNLTYFDPYLSYSSILKNLEGPSDAKILLSKFRDEQPQNPAANLIYILSKDNPQDKITLLKSLTQQFPDYGPIYYYLAMQYSFQENGLATNEEKKAQREAINKLNELEKTQQFSKFLIDKSKAEEMLTEIKTQGKMLEGMLGQMIDQPITVKITPVNKSISIAFIPTELVQKIFYRLNQEGEFKDTGDSGISMAGQTTTLPNYQVMEALPLGSHTIEVKYQDTKGNISPVYSFPFQVDALTLNYPPYKMIDPETGEPQYLVSWSFYDSSADYEVNYSVNNPSLDQKVEFVLYLKDLPAGKHTLYMQGTNTQTKEKTNLAEMEFTIN